MSFRRFAGYSFLSVIFVVVATYSFGQLSLDSPYSAIFKVPPAYETGGVSALTLADVNGDGKPDLLVANGTNGLTVLLGNGDGTFQSPAAYNSGGSYPTAIAAADVNGDGKLDVIIANMYGGVSVLIGNGDGTFQSVSLYASGVGVQASGLAVADVNNDGKLDLLVSNFYGSGGSSVGVLLGNGNGTFQTAVELPTGGYQATAVAVGDLNADGKPDLVISNRCVSIGSCANGVIGVLWGNGNGTFQNPMTYNAGGGLSLAVVVADVNQDGKLDVIVANECSGTGFCNDEGGTVTVLLGNGFGFLAPAVSYNTGAFWSAFLAVKDVNADGNPDLIVGNYCEGTGYRGVCFDSSISVLLGNGDGSFRAPTVYASGGPVVAGDVNGDGKLDLLARANSCVSGQGCGGDKVAVLFGNGDGTFQGVLAFPAGGPLTSAIVAADLNGDSKLDLVLANQCLGIDSCATGAVAVLKGNGDGTFRTALTYNSGGYGPVSLTVADLNGDSKPDVVIGNICLSNTICPSGSIGVLLGNGDGTLQPVSLYNSGGTYPVSVAAVDVNGDGKPDLLAVNQFVNFSDPSGRIAVLLGNGNGTFQQPITYSTGGQQASAFAVADVNGDGFPDLLVTNACDISGSCSNGVVGILLNDGHGSFQTAVTYNSGAQYAVTVAVGDLNSDGRLDLIVVNECSTSACPNSTVSVRLGNGDGTFQTASNTDVFQMTQGNLVLADFDGDGNLDVASGAGDFLLFGNGDGSFKSPLLLGAGGQGIAVGDFNGDHKPDIAVGSLAVLLNISTGVKAPTSTSVTSAQNPSIYGQAVTFHVAVTTQGSATPTGTVTVNDGPNVLGTDVLVNGATTVGTAALSSGTHNITAYYGGDANSLPSTSSSLSQTVNKTTTNTTLASSANPSYLNQQVTFTATVNSQYGGAVSGTVTFKQGTTVLATVPLSNGKATYSVTYTATGTRSITAIYSGDSNDLGSTSVVLSQVVSTLPAATTTTITTTGTPTFIHLPVTFTARVTSTYGPIPDGEIVTLTDGTVTLASLPLSVGTVTYTTSSLKAGTHTIKAAYAGDTTFKPSSKSISQVIKLYPSTTTLISSLNPSTFGQSVILTATVTSTAPGAPTGNVAFKNGTTLLGTAALNASGVATLKKANIPAGTDSLTAVYKGDSETATSTSAVVVQTVHAATTTAALTSSLNPAPVGQTVTFTCKVTSPTTIPTGTVTFMDGATVLSTVTLASGKASLSTVTLAAGSHNLTAVYNGTSNITGSTSPTLVEVVN